MKRINALLFCLFTGVLFSQNNHFNFSIDQKSGKVILTIDKLNEEFLMVSYLSNGLGSNDVGLDRGKIMSQRIVKFAKFGDKIMLVEPNYDYRAVSENAREKKSVEEAFAKSIIYGFKIDNRGFRFLCPIRVQRGYAHKEDHTPFPTLLKTAQRVSNLGLNYHHLLFQTCV
jgi:hypothetical protein